MLLNYFIFGIIAVNWVCCSNVPVTANMHIYLDTDETQFMTTTENEFYLQGFEGQTLQLVFKNHTKFSEGSVNCKIHNSATRSNATLTVRGETFGDTSHTHFILAIRNNGYVYCTSETYPDAILNFYLFISSRKSTQYFARNTIEKTKNDNGFYVACTGTYPSNETQLWINGNETNYTYDPKKGFHMQNLNESVQYYFECINGNQIVSNSIGKEYTSENEKFEIRMSENGEMAVECVFTMENLTDETSIEDMFISCDRADVCKTKMEKVITPNTVKISLPLPTHSKISATYYCIFQIQDQGVVVRPMFVDIPFAFSPFKIIVFFIMVILVTFGVTYVVCLRVQQKEEKKYKLLKNRISSDGLKCINPERDTIGTGYSSKIYRIPKLDESGEWVAVKASLKKNYACLKKEAIILSDLDHPNVIYPESLSGPRGLWKVLPVVYIDRIVFPYYKRLSLDKYLPTFKRSSGSEFYSSEHDEYLSHFELISFVWQLASALVHLEEKEITHRDLALRNILVGESGVIKLSDFERAKRGETELNSRIGSMKWLMCRHVSSRKIPFKSYPLEALEGTYKYSSDVWAFGIIALEIFNLGKETFGDIQNASIYEKTLRSMDVKQYYKKPVDCPKKIYENVILECLSNERTQRAAIKSCEFKLSEFLQEMNSEKRNKLTSTLRKELGKRKKSAIDESVLYVTKNEAISLLMG